MEKNERDGIFESSKSKCIKKVLSPNNESILSLGKEMGISDQTIRNWLKDCKSGKLKLDTLEPSPRYFSIHEKYRIIRGFCGMSESELDHFLRR